jgi:hypothetical protein
VNVTIHALRDGKAWCGSKASKALTPYLADVTCQPCKQLLDAEQALHPPVQHIVVASLRDGDAIEVEVYGPFQTALDAGKWCDAFERWMEVSDREVEHLLITRLDRPFVVGTAMES